MTSQRPLHGLNGSDICKTGGKLVIHIGQCKTLECENAKVMEKGITKFDRGTRAGGKLCERKDWEQSHNF